MKILERNILWSPLRQILTSALPVQVLHLINAYWLLRFFLQARKNNIYENELDRDIKEGGTILEVIPEDFRIFNPNTLNSPIFKRQIPELLEK